MSLLGNGPCRPYYGLLWWITIHEMLPLSLLSLLLLLLCPP